MDVHEKTIVIFAALDRNKGQGRSFNNTPPGKQKLRSYLRGLGDDGSEIHVAYEASQWGFCLRDEMQAEGIHCYVLAPSKIERSSKEQRQKTDKKDAEKLLELLRGFLLAGNTLPAIWIPSVELRSDREIVRARIDTQARTRAAKNRIVSLTKRWECRKTKDVGNNWTLSHRQWLDWLTGALSPLPAGVQISLESLLKELEFLEAQVKALDKAVLELSREERYAPAVKALMSQFSGVGILTAMVFLTEIGDISRFSNRRQFAAFLGLVPACAESGDKDDRKFRITRQGSGRLRGILCQATHVRIGARKSTATLYDRVKAKNPNKKKKAVVAEMRKMALEMRQVVLEVHRETGVYPTGWAPGEGVGA